ncbi:MAG: phosphatidylserine decarboxylase family protein [Prevotellaceae bacterium]|jgi:phosphatidylserine decarboxylase|nr:phosphatidylserine decarboxylase family protein [Prevotellaceae bacterium]
MPKTPIKTMRLKNRAKRRNRRFKVHKEGRAILISFFTLICALNLLFYFIGETRVNFGFIVNLIVSIFAFGFFMYFFRNPTRLAEINDEGLVIAPADGRIVVIEPTEEYEYFEGQKMMQVSIFMSPFNVHANWYPVNGKVLYAKHHNGNHVAAYLPKSSRENERATTVIETKSGKKLLVRQIAGALARRIVTYAAANQPAQLNQHLGFIKFGSRVDLFLPLNSEIFVNLNEHTIGNQTIIARLLD